MSREDSLMEPEICTVDTLTTIDAEEAGCLENKVEQINGMSIDHDQLNKVTSSENKETTTTATIDEDIGCLMDVLHLHMLQLIEDQISQQLALETQTARARLLLAQTRLQQGTQNFAAASRLPGNTPYRALYRLLQQGVKWGSSFKLLRFDVEPARNYLLPVTQIFGALVPYSLRLASHKWERCVEQIVECVNIQRELQSVVKSIERLNWVLHRRDNV
ncbi:uncharacterized protein [Drosophila virilis]|nr:uncharacterized protein LOC6624345 [Drosophila virilis]